MSHGHTPTQRQPLQSRHPSRFRALSLGLALLAGAGCGAPEQEDVEEQTPLATAGASLSAGTLGCYIDTNANDVPTPGRCIGANSVPTYITFVMIGASPGYTYQWSEPSCGTTTSSTCSIFVNRSTVITMSVIVKTSTGTVVDNQSATARFHLSI